MSLKQRLQATPLMLGENISRLGRGGDRCALELALAVPLLQFDVAGPDRLFWHKTSSVKVGELALAAGMSAPFSFAVAEQERATLMVAGRGGADVLIGGQHLRNSANAPLLYLPGEAYRCSFSDPDGLALSLPIAGLASRALALVSRQGLRGIDLGVLQQPRLFAAHGDAGRIGALLRRTLTLIDSALRTQQLAGAAAALENALIQQLCLLIYPELLQGCVDSAAAA